MYIILLSKLNLKVGYLSKWSNSLSLGLWDTFTGNKLFFNPHSFNDRKNVSLIYLKKVVKIPAVPHHHHNNHFTLFR